MPSMLLLNLHPLACGSQISHRNENTMNEGWVPINRFSLATFMFCSLARLEFLALSFFMLNDFM